MRASFTRLEPRGVGWGVRVWGGDPREMDTITVSKRDGTTVAVTLRAMLYENKQNGTRVFEILDEEDESEEMDLHAFMPEEGDRW